MFFSLTVILCFKKLGLGSNEALTAKLKEVQT